jgi:putative ABC transport system permease protein
MISPPKYPLRFLRWFCREDYLDEIEGDLIELFEKRCEKSPEKARRRFVWDVVKSFRIRNIRSIKAGQNSNITAMFQHTILLAFRSFLRYKSAFAVNLIGLSTGLACAMFIYLWVNDELNVDGFHEKNDRLYQVMQHRVQDGALVTSTWVPGLTASTLEEEFPEVEYAIPTFGKGEYTLSVEEKDLQAEGQSVGKDLFNMFSFPLIQGDADQVLASNSSIVISETLARALFHSVDAAIGKTIQLEHDDQFQVSGVFKDIPNNSSLKFDFVLSFNIYLEHAGWARRWQTSWPETYVLLTPGADFAAFNEKIADLIKRKTNGEITYRTMFAAPYAASYLYGNYENGLQAGGRIEYVRLFSVIAIFIIAIACVNFMNLSTARASRRLKEVGIKKAVGAGRSALAFQFLGESMLLTVIAMILATGLVALLLPQFNLLTGKQLSLHFGSAITLPFVAIALVTGLVSGSYPALYLSSFSPSAVLKGKLNKSTGETWARKGLVVLQFTISIIMMVSVTVVYKQIEFVQNKHLGYDKENILLLDRKGWDPGALKTFLSEAKKVPGVLHASSIEHTLIEHVASTNGVSWPGKDPENKTEFEMMAVNYDMLELLGVEVEAGRLFSREFGADSTKVIFNEAAIKLMGLNDPVGMQINLWGEDRQIIGVLKDFHFESLHKDVEPVVLWLAPHRTSKIAIRLEAGKEKEVIAQLEPLYNTFYSGFPFDYRFLDQQYQQEYLTEQRVSTLSRYFAGLAILISCLGLFGLAAFTAERRLKEIGIRRILGSSMVQIVYMLSASFSKMVLVAIVIALPVSYFLTDYWLDNFAYRIDLKWWYFASSGVLALVITWLIVGWQSLKVASVSPSKYLRQE